MCNCCLDNIRLISSQGRPPKILFLVKRGSCNYEEIPRLELAKKLDKSVSWIDTHTDIDDAFLWNHGRYYISSCLENVWDLI